MFVNRLHILAVIGVLIMVGALLLMNSNQKDVAMIKAALDGQINEVRRFLNEGIDVNAGADNGVTSLMVASSKGHEDIVRLLLEKGADVAVKERKGRPL